MAARPAWPSPLARLSVFGLWLRGWSIPQHAARLWTPYPLHTHPPPRPITKRLLFEQILPGVTLSALHHLKGQAQQMAWKTLLSLAVNPRLTNEHVCSQDNTEAESPLSRLREQLSICIQKFSLRQIWTSRWRRSSSIWSARNVIEKMSKEYKMVFN